MRRPDERFGIEVMEHEECLARIRERGFGRIAVVQEGHPVISPIHYATVDEAVVFRIAKTSKLEEVLRGGPVSFEVDDVDLDAGRGWSVVVTGWARVATTPAQAEHFATLGLPRWGPEGSDVWIVVHPERINGRRLTVEPDPVDG